MDEYGTDFAAPVVSKVKKESERLEKIHGVNVASTQNDQPPPPVVMAPDRGRKLVFDNFDFKQHVHNMTEDHLPTRLGMSCSSGEPCLWLSFV